MTVIAVTKDADARTMTITARFAAPLERVWELWSDPRQLERWWGPPDYPARVLEHDLRAGGGVTYVLTGEAGDRYGGYWRLRTVDPPRQLEFEDGFADEHGRPDAALPATNISVALADAGGGTEMEIVFAFPSREAMEQMLDRGFEAGLTGSVAQIDALLAA